MSAARTRNRTGSKKKLTEAQKKARAKRDAEKFARTSASAGLPSGRAIGASMFEKCHDDNLKVEERIMKLTYARLKEPQTAQQQIQI